METTGAIEKRLKTQVRLSGELLRWLHDEAERQAVSFNQVLTNAVRFYRRNREAAE